MYRFNMNIDAVSESERVPLLKRLVETIEFSRAFSRNDHGRENDFETIYHIMFSQNSWVGSICVGWWQTPTAQRRLRAILTTTTYVVLQKISSTSPVFGVTVRNLQINLLAKPISSRNVWCCEMSNRAQFLNIITLVAADIYIYSADSNTFATHSTSLHPNATIPISQWTHATLQCAYGCWFLSAFVSA